MTIKSLTPKPPQLGTIMSAHSDRQYAAGESVMLFDMRGNHLAQLECLGPTPPMLHESVGHGTQDAARNFYQFKVVKT